MSDASLLRQLADLIEAGTPCATVQIVRATGSIPNALGATMLVGAGGALIAGTVGGGAIELRCLEAAAGAIAQGKSQLYAAKLTDAEAGGIGMMCGGTAEVFIDVHNPDPHLVLLGAGHVNKSLARLADGLGFRLTVIDDRPEWANADNYPNAAVVQARPEDALATLGLDRHAFVVIATRDSDGPALVAAAATPARYIGVVASKRKAIQLLRDIGPQVDLPGLLPRLHAPIGLRLGGRSPEAVALSILAEVQALRHDADGAPMALPADKLTGYL